MYQNGEQLIGFIGILRRQLSERREMSIDERRSLHADLDFLSLGIARAFTAITQLAVLQIAAGSYAKQYSTITPGHGVFVLTPDHRDPMAFEVDSFLDGIRRSQDGLVCAISRTLTISLRRSMSALIKALESGKKQVPPEVSSVLKNYWSKHGLVVKHYRDATQHHMIVASDARIFLNLDGTPFIHLLLPNNPEEKSAARFRYENPQIHAFEYMVDEFLAMVEVTYQVTRYLALLGPDPNKAILSIAFQSPIGFGPDGKLDGMTGHPVQAPGEFVERVRDLLISLETDQHD